MAIKFSNNASAELATALTAYATTLTVREGYGEKFPSLSEGDYFYVTLVGDSTMEIVKVTATSGDTFTIVRAQDNTEALEFSEGSLVELRITAATFSDISNTFNVLTTKVDTDISNLNTSITSSINTLDSNTTTKLNTLESTFTTNLNTLSNDVNNNFLKLSGGTMKGNIDMGSKNISSAATISANTCNITTATISGTLNIPGGRIWIA